MTVYAVFSSTFQVAEMTLASVYCNYDEQNFGDHVQKQFRNPVLNCGITIK
jgi:hypothetical protein